MIVLAEILRISLAHPDLKVGIVTFITRRSNSALLTFYRAPIAVRLSFLALTASDVAPVPPADAGSMAGARVGGLRTRRRCEYVPCVLMHLCEAYDVSPSSSSSNPLAPMRSTTHRTSSRVCGDLAPRARGAYTRHRGDGDRDGPVGKVGKSAFLRD